MEILSSNAVVKPIAMMIELRNTLLTMITVHPVFSNPSITRTASNHVLRRIDRVELACIYVRENFATKVCSSYDISPYADSEH